MLEQEIQPRHTAFAKPRLKQEIALTPPQALLDEGLISMEALSRVEGPLEQ